MRTHPSVTRGTYTFSSQTCAPACFARHAVGRRLRLLDSRLASLSAEIRYCYARASHQAMLPATHVSSLPLPTGLPGRHSSPTVLSTYGTLRRPGNSNRDQPHAKQRVSPPRTLDETCSQNSDKAEAKTSRSPTRLIAAPEWDE